MKLANSINRSCKIFTNRIPSVLDGFYIEEISLFKK